MASIPRPLRPASYNWPRIFADKVATSSLVAPTIKDLKGCAFHDHARGDTRYFARRLKVLGVGSSRCCRALWEVQDHRTDQKAHERAAVSDSPRAIHAAAVECKQH